MAGAEAFRHLVVARAGGACEYRRLLEAPAGVTFHVEHVLPRSQGGDTILANLALSCPGCNLAKGNRTHGSDADGKTQPLFNPRQFESWLLGWHMHFLLELSTGVTWSVYPNPTFHEQSVARGWQVLPRPADFVEEAKLA